MKDSKELATLRKLRAHCTVHRGGIDNDDDVVVHFQFWTNWNNQNDWEGFPSRVGRRTRTPLRTSMRTYCTFAEEDVDEDVDEDVNDQDGLYIFTLRPR